MSIEKSPGYTTGQGDDQAWHPTLLKAQHHEFRILFGDITGSEDIINRLFVHKDKVLEILRATGRKPRQKKAKVGRPKKPKLVHGKASSEREQEENNAVERAFKREKTTFKPTMSPTDPAPF